MQIPREVYWQIRRDIEKELFDERNKDVSDAELVTN